ncbi:hypothetical protein ACE193_08595 [Bernardetia sp. OM2101]|uniref:hypothetical protein n=1 Tax=Bernardetia sp. OM2101 TaxID=3344876 RepID=UPI0035CF9ECF
MKNKTLSFGVMGLHIAFGLAFLGLILMTNINTNSINFENSFFIILLILVVGISLVYLIQFFINKHKAKYLSYVIAFLMPLIFAIRFIVQCIFYLKEPPIYPWSWQGAILPVILVSLPSLLLFFLSFSPHLYQKENIIKEQSSLDTLFIKSQEVSSCSYFWRIHRTFAIILMFISIVLFVLALFAKTLPFYVGTLISSLSCLLLWFHARLGSILVSFFCGLILMACSFYLIFLLKSSDYSASVFLGFTAVFLFVGSIPFILINDTTRQEWKMK